MTQGVAPQHGREGQERPRWLLPAVLSAVVVVVAGIVVAVLLTRSGDDGATAPTPVTTTVVVPVPTPSVEPVAREATTAFTAVLPSTVLQYALASSAADAEWVAAGALEAWTDTYTDGGAGQLTVRAGQWAAPEEAAAFAATLVSALPVVEPAPAPTGTAGTETAAPSAGDLPRTGDVTAAGATVGTYTIVDAGDGTGVAVWTNGTAVFRMVAPVDEITSAWAQYPL